MRGPAAVLLLLLAACGGEPPPSEKPRPQATTTSTAAAEPYPDDIDDDNLLNLAYGASVVSRTGELSLENSVVQGIDGMSHTRWTSPPNGAAQEMVFAFGGPSRVERLGVTTIAGPHQIPEQVRFEASLDGRKWREVLTLQPKGTELRPVTPFEARYIRLTTIEEKEGYAVFNSFHAIGRETAPPQKHSLDGCWTVNLQPARLVQNGARVTGVIDGKTPTYLDGATDGRVARVLWMRGPTWGYAAITVTPDGQALSAATFFQEPLNGNYGPAWFGERCEEKASGFRPLGVTAQQATPPRGPAPDAQLFFKVARRYSLFEFDSASLDVAASLIAAAPSQGFRVVAHEFRSTDPRENEQRSAARIAEVRRELAKRGVDLKRVEFVASGSSRKDAEPTYAIQRLLYSRVDLEFFRP